ncbi:MAG: sugar ABC transporter ATP-binding protein, partial [Paraburkholderia sp.]
MAHPTPDPSNPVRGRDPAAPSHADSSAQTGEIEPILATAAVSKTFPGVKALQNVDFRLFPGEVHTL